MELSLKECARDMVQRSNDAAVKDVQIMFTVEECARDMVQRSSYAAEKDAQIVFKEEGSASGTVHRSINQKTRRSNVSEEEVSISC